MVSFTEIENGRSPTTSVHIHHIHEANKMTELLKEALHRVTKNDLSRRTTLKKEVVENFNPYSRALQIIEVSTWIDENVGFPSEGEIGDFCRAFASAISVPSVRIFKQIVRFSHFAIIPNLRDQLDDKIVSAMMGIFIWIICASSYSQVLTLLFGLYDLFDDGYLDKQTATALFTDVLIDDDSINDPKIANKGMIQVNEIIEELFKYADARRLITNSCKEERNDIDLGSSESLRFPSRIHTSNQRNIYSTKSIPEDTESGDTNSYRTSDIFKRISRVFNPLKSRRNLESKISCQTFIRLFIKKKSTTLWQIHLIQDKLRQACFGHGTWDLVQQWTIKHAVPNIDAKGPRLRETLMIIGTEVARFLSIQNDRPLLGSELSSPVSVARSISMSPTASRIPSIEEHTPDHSQSTCSSSVQYSPTRPTEPPQEPKESIIPADMKKKSRSIIPKLFRRKARDES